MICSALKLITNFYISLIKVQRRIAMAEYSMRYFADKQWHFINENMWKVWRRMSEEDQKVVEYKTFFDYCRSQSEVGSNVSFIFSVSISIFVKLIGNNIAIIFAMELELT